MLLRSLNLKCKKILGIEGISDCSLPGATGNNFRQYPPPRANTVRLWRSRKISATTLPPTESGRLLEITSNVPGVTAAGWPPQTKILATPLHHFTFIHFQVSDHSIHPPCLRSCSSELFPVLYLLQACASGHLLPCPHIFSHRYNFSQYICQCSACVLVGPL